MAQVVRGSASIGWDDLQTTFRVMLDSATERLSAGHRILRAGRLLPRPAVRGGGRGVEVDVLLPGPHADKRVCQLASEAAYDQLTSCGVRVWNFQPAMMHAKIMIVDGIAAVVGSSNFNRRSLDHDEEVVLVALRDCARVASRAGTGGLLDASDRHRRSTEHSDLTRWRHDRGHGPRGQTGPGAGSRPDAARAACRLLTRDIRSRRAGRGRRPLDGVAPSRGRARGQRQPARNAFGLVPAADYPGSSRALLAHPS